VVSEFGAVPDDTACSGEPFHVRTPLKRNDPTPITRNTVRTEAPTLCVGGPTPPTSGEPAPRYSGRWPSYFCGAQ
jgi:hypothetical protein